MSKKYILLLVMIVSLSALAFKGYTYFRKQTASAVQLEVPKIRTDLFAINELIAVIRQLKDAKTIDAEFTTMLIGKDHKTDMGSFEGRYVKDSANLYIQSIGSENLLNKDYFVAVDHNEEMIFVEKPEMNSKTDFFQFGFLADIDSLVNLPDSIVFFERVDDKTGKLSFEWSYAQYYKTELIYDLETKVLKSVNLYPYQDIFLEQEEGEISDQPLAGIFENNDEELPEYIEIAYSSLKINQPVNKKWFDVSRYFNVENNTLVLSKSFKAYEIDFE